MIRSVLALTLLAGVALSPLTALAQGTLRIGMTASDIPLTTGPHLGGFNQQISLPELIEFVAAASAGVIGALFAAKAGVEAGEG